MNLHFLKLLLPALHFFILTVFQLNSAEKMAELNLDRVPKPVIQELGCGEGKAK